MTLRTGLELRSLISAEGQLRLSLEPVEVPAPAPGEVLVAVQAAPINPSDLGLLLGHADLSTLAASGSDDRPVITAAVPQPGLGHVSRRFGLSLAVGNEGAGVVVQAGAGAEGLLGKTVAIAGGAMYAEFRLIPAADCLVLPDTLGPMDGAASYINPMTVLGMTVTMRDQGHSAIIHTAGASNLGQMLSRLCHADGIPLISIVRSQAQVSLLRSFGARHVLDSTGSSFFPELVAAIRETGATIAFDAIGGGSLAGVILQAMEAAASETGAPYNRYGSNTFKQIYTYGNLDLSPTVIDRTFGFSWSLGGWLLTSFLSSQGPERVATLRQRVLSELTTTFASRYTAEISLRDALKPENLRAYARRATGEKYCINPSI